MRFTIISLLICLGLPCIGQARTFLVGKHPKNEVTFHATATPGFLSIDGSGGFVEGKIELKDGKYFGEFSCNLDDFDLGFPSLRTYHMKNWFLETGKYPYAKLVLENVSFKASGTAEGMLTIKKETKPVKITYKVNDGILSADFVVKIKDYPSIGLPEHKGVKLSDEVEVNVKFPFSG